MVNRGAGSEKKKKKKSVVAKVPAAPKAASLLGQSLGGRASVARLSVAAPEGSGGLAFRPRAALSPSATPPAPARDPATEGAEANCVPLPVATVAPLTSGDGAMPHPQAAGHIPGHTAAKSSSAPAPIAQQVGALATRAAPLAQGARRGLAPLAPVEARVATSPAVVPPAAPTPPPEALVLAKCGPLIREGALAEAHAALGRLEADIWDADRCLARERHGVVSGWSQVEVATQTAWRQAKASTIESKKEAADAKEARDAALAKAEEASKRCGEAEASLKALQEEQSAHTLQLQQLEDGIKAREA